MASSAWLGIEHLTDSSWGPLQGNEAGEACFKVLERFENSEHSRIRSIVVPGCSTALTIDILRRCGNLRGLTALNTRLPPSGSKTKPREADLLDEILSRPQCWVDLVHLDVEMLDYHFMNSAGIPDSLTKLTTLCANMFVNPDLRKLKYLKQLKLTGTSTLSSAPFPYVLGWLSGLPETVESLKLDSDDRLTTFNYFSHLTNLRSLNLHWFKFSHTMVRAKHREGIVLASALLTPCAVSGCERSQHTD